MSRHPRAVAVLAIAAALQPVLVAACTSGGTSGPGAQRSSSPSTTRAAAHGPFFPECGGVTDETVSRLTRVPGLVTTARNSVGCQWLARGTVDGPWFSFTWFRGSPIGRERSSEERMRPRVDDITIDGHHGFIAVASVTKAVNRLCDVAIQYQDDFFEWSIRYQRRPLYDPCDIAVELSRQSIAAAR
ncbi:DUF3558 domain-containing protein [Mycobacterium kubicae]|uniref:DUF3558 domain-containing protein n=1 Tax=Mycobacterium kubicae TaxID=120959 RepID=A0AAX1JCU6_9MYCO|nr:DUF3558 domain-containing protein [Mycobacterium kubicae]MCV7093791.1 DUF3558 domain-containing protein [Mycobacterium kubicae]ORW00871.1 hypothetical protein AWC13_07995 [Mycobacterium kubicae]QNI10061.1 DUF3558 domain-containing protein [Mycobacterium kubicae]QPI38264.1 DUF3558 domain-containing protein [Mycobacterium kubicae]